jgi:hypothetical protein
MKKIHILFINSILIIAGTAIAEYGREIMNYSNYHLGILLILLGSLLIIAGIFNLNGFSEFLEKLINPEIEYTIVKCPICEQKCNVPKSKNLEIKCPNCNKKWITKT